MSYKIKKIDNLLEKRRVEYPYKGDVKQELYEELDVFIDSLLKDFKSNQFKINKKLTFKLNDFIENPVFIGGNMKSGTTLLLQLLDSHSDMVVMPGDSHYMNSNKKLKKYDFNSIARYWLKRMINPTPAGTNWFLGKNSEQYFTFLTYLELFLNEDRFDYSPFVCVVSAVYATKHKNSLQKICWVEKTPKNEYCVENIFRTFPKARFINLIREPLSNISSLKRLSHYRDSSFSAWHEALGYKKLANKALKNFNDHKNDYYILKYEDMVSDTENTMRKVSDFLDVPFEDTMLQPTEGGKSTSSNSMYSEQRKDAGKVIDKTNSQKWKKELNNKEKRFIVSILEELPLSFDYNYWGQEEILQHKSFLLYLFFQPVYWVYSKYIDLKNNYNEK